MKTKIISLLLVLSVGSILLVACSRSTATTASSKSLSTATRLAVGTLKLEGTDQAVTTSQATELLTLWEAYQSLSTSDTASQVELDALVKQIEGLMTSDQIKSIDAMDLTDQSVSEVVQSLEGSVPSSTPAAAGGNLAAPAGGPGGMPPDGGINPMGDITSGLVALSTPAATQSASSAQTSQVDVMLLRALVQMLQTRSQPTG